MCDVVQPLYRPGALKTYPLAAKIYLSMDDRCWIEWLRAALQFVLAHPAIAAIIPGTRRPERVGENLDLVREAIPSAFWAELKQEGPIPERAPVPGDVG